MRHTRRRRRIGGGYGLAVGAVALGALAATGTAEAFTLELSLTAQQPGPAAGQFLPADLALPLTITASTSGGPNATTIPCQATWELPRVLPPPDYVRGSCSFTLTHPQGTNTPGAAFDVRVEATMPPTLRSYLWRRPSQFRSDDLICPDRVSDRTSLTLQARLGARPECSLEIIVEGAEPDDCPASATRGTPGPDVLTGTAGRDVICGLGGNDLLRGLAGDDTLIGGDGEDILVGGPGRDTLISTGDTVFGGGDADRIRSTGAPVILGGRGNDVIEVSGGGLGVAGCAGDDVITGGAAAQTLQGDYLAVSGADVVDALGLDGVTGADAQCDRATDAPAGAGPGSDTLRGLAGPDELFGGPGGDDLSGGDGNDELLGQGGRDLLEGGRRKDVLVGGPGDDLELNGGAGDDVLVGCGGRDLLDGGDGSDDLWGDARVPALAGCARQDDDRDAGPTAASADRLLGGAGTDDLVGGPGNDVLVGGPGRDDLRGGAGVDGLLARDRTRDRRVDGGADCDDGTLDRFDPRVSIRFTNLDRSGAPCVRRGAQAPQAR